MSEDAEREHQELLWTAALEKLGRDNVRIQLGQMLPDRSAPFKLPDQRGCKRGFAADWLALDEAKEKTTEAKRHRQNLAVTIVLGILAVAVAIAIAWWFNK